jgi:hypothetical protein
VPGGLDDDDAFLRELRLHAVAEDLQGEGLLKAAAAGLKGRI